MEEIGVKEQSVWSRRLGEEKEQDGRRKREVMTWTRRTGRRNEEEKYSSGRT